MTGGPEERLRDIQRRFRAVSARLDHAAKLRRWYRLCKMTALTALVSFALSWVLLSLSPWPAMMTLRHIASFPNCNAACAVGLAPARKGEPGYWTRHDADDDGIACEPLPRRWERQ
jgi:Excalibur calcium-binding domain